MHKNYYVFQIRLCLFPSVDLFGVRQCRVFESHYNLTAASLGLKHGQLTNWNICYRKTEGQNMFATPTTPVQQARLLLYMLHVFFLLLFLLLNKRAGSDYLPASEYKT